MGPLITRDRDGLFYDTEYPVLSNTRDYPIGDWEELDNLRTTLNNRILIPERVGPRDVYYAITRWRRSERYREIAFAPPAYSAQSSGE
jgi:hypothetical protein